MVYIEAFDASTPYFVNLLFHQKTEEYKDYWPSKIILKHMGELSDHYRKSAHFKSWCQLADAFHRQLSEEYAWLWITLMESFYYRFRLPQKAYRGRKTLRRHKQAESISLQFGETFYISMIDSMIYVADNSEGNSLLPDLSKLHDQMYELMEKMKDERPLPDGWERSLDSALNKTLGALLFKASYRYVGSYL